MAKTRPSRKKRATGKPSPKSRKPAAKAKPTPKRTPPAPKKRKLSQTPEAKRARARRADRRAAELESLRLSAAAAKAAASKKRAAAKARKRRALERESAELGEAEHRATEQERQLGRLAGDERTLFIDILDDMRNIGSAHVPLSLEITEAEPGARIPWLVVGRFDPIEDCTYGELDAVFRAWELDIPLEAKIHPQRLSQIRIIYSDPNRISKRGEGDFIVSHTGPWEAVISEIALELSPDDEDSLANRYEHTVVPQFYVYFSGHLASELEISL